MPFAGSTASVGQGRVGAASSSLLWPLSIAIGPIPGNTPWIRMVGFSKLAVRVVQTSGAVPTVAQVQIRSRASDSDINYDSIPIGAIGVPVIRTYVPLVTRLVRVSVENIDPANAIVVEVYLSATAA